MQRSTIKNIDFGLLGLFVLLCVLGWLNIYSATYEQDYSNIFSLEKEYGKQALWIGVSFFLGFIILNLSGKFINRSAYIIYALVMLSLVGVLFMPPISGARSWYKIASFSFQPAEFAKFATALALAKYLGQESIRFKDFQTRFMAIALIAIPGILVLLQPDVGTLLVFVSFVLVLYREGLSGNILLLGLLWLIIGVLSIFFNGSTIKLPIINYQAPSEYVFISFIALIFLIILYLQKYTVQKREFRKKRLILIIVGIITIGIGVSANLAFDNVLKSHHRDRINLLLGKIEDNQGAGYNIHRAMSAIGSGDLIGRGYRNGLLANEELNHVPEQGTDFIFCSIGEEWGFLGSFGIITLFLLLLFKIIIIAERQRSQFTRIYAYGVAGIIFIHFMINLGMVIGLLPVIGIPMPFFSYGGSSLWGFAIMIFLLLKLDSERMDILR